MVDIVITEDACRGCRLCIDVCPTEVLSFNETELLATIEQAEDCIACLSCAYLCPSSAIRLDNYPAVKNFYRDLEFSRRIERFL